MTISLIRGQIIQPWVDPRIEARPSRVQGRGLFAREPIGAGEAVVVWGGVVYTRADMDAGLARAGTAAQLGDDLFLADAAENLDSPDYYLNHACDPNVWLRDAVTLTARRDIAVGEELTADYATWEADPAWELAPCHCGAALCRGRVSGDDWQRSELQARYAGHFTPYLQGKIETWKR